MDHLWLWISIVVVIAVVLDLWLVPILWRSARVWKPRLAEWLEARRAAKPAAGDPAADKESLMDVPPVAPTPERSRTRVGKQKSVVKPTVALAVKVQPGSRIELNIQVEDNQTSSSQQTKQKLL